jgi:Ca-activated chloride channel homolog
MKRRIITTLLTVCWLIVPLNALAQQRSALAPARLPGGNTDAPITSSTELVSLRLSVTDQQGAAVPGLERSSFAVYEDGVRQEISFFSEQDTPSAVGIVLDVSGSMTGEKLSRARETLARFSQTSHAEDEYYLISFNQSPQLLLDGVRGSEALLAGLAGIRPQGHTALYDAVGFALAQVAHSRLPKRALIVISDGEDNRSRLSLGDVRRLLREADVTVYSILIGPLLPRSNGGAVLDGLAAASGGRSYFPSNGEQMSETFEQIALELRRQYSIAYTPSNLVADGKWRQIRVSVTPSQQSRRLVVRSRKGYVPKANLLEVRQ